MSQYKCLYIGGISFHIQVPGNSSLVEPDPAYKNFFIRPSYRITDRVNVDLRCLKTPENRQAEIKLSGAFDADSVWHSFKKSGKRYFVLNMPRSSETQRVIKAGKNNIEVFYKLTSGKNINPFRYPMDQLVIMNHLAGCGGFILHAAGAEIAGKGIAFAGVSGAGKSTISRFLAMQKIEVVSDDRLVVRGLKKKWEIYGTPWPGDAGMALNRKIRLDALMFLAHGRSNKIRELSRPEAFKRLVSIISVPWYEKELTNKVIGNIIKMMEQVRLYEIEFAPDKRVAGFVSDHVRENLR